MRKLINPTLFFCFVFVFAYATSAQSFFEKENKFLIESEKNTIEVFKQSSPLVVSVDSTMKKHDFFSMSTREIPTGSGSGFIWDNQGHIVTNYHVIQGAQNFSRKIWVRTKDGKKILAKIVGSEPGKDIAVLKVDKNQLSQLGFESKVADSNKLQVGQKVLAIGNPFGFDQTLTTGIVSALKRSMPAVNSNITIRNMIQTDASINPGNSGGPLLDSRGYLIGMNTAIISGSGSSAGIGFAVPSNTIARLTKQIIKYGQIQKPGIGITGLSQYQKLNLVNYGYDINEGAVIASVIKGSPADKAGLIGIKPRGRRGVLMGDIIIKLDNEKISDFDDLYNLLSEKDIGDQVKLTINRHGKIIHKRVSLDVINFQS